MNLNRRSTNYTDSISKNDLLLDNYHSRFDQSQFDYFNPWEKKYYEDFLKEHICPRPVIKNKIKCKKENVIGKGGYGHVYKGFDVNNKNLPMAIKEIMYSNIKD